MYGTSDGKCGLIELSLEEPLPKWELVNEKRLGGITSLDSFDVTSDGIMDLVIAREDGVVEVYVYDSVDQPYLKYTYVSKIKKKNVFIFYSRNFFNRMVMKA